MFTPEEIYQAAQTLRPHLKELLGDDGEEGDRQLATLLDQAQVGQPVHQQILQLLGRDPRTSAQLEELLSPSKGFGASRGFDNLPGQASSFPSTVYICPQCPPTDPYTWSRPTIGDPIESCPTHGCLLVPKGSKP